MPGPDRPADRPKPAAPARSADVVQLAQWAVPATQPDTLSAAEALKIVRALAADTRKIVIIGYGKRRARQRQITHRQIELCVQKGTIAEGPFPNRHGHWQMNLYRHAAGEEITCVVAIDWVTKVLVINTF
jgi:hypothetical protein